MNMKMRRFFFTLLSVSAFASAESVWENRDALEAKVDSINARRGVEIGGSIRAVSQLSSFDSDQDKNAKNEMPDTERNEFAAADLDFHFRPFENVRANVMLRFGAGMQEYFSSASKTLSIGWANVEGNIGNSLYWVVGDFREQYSPLTLFAPGIDILYEPTIFARKRHMAEAQELIDGNQRNLQGANVQFRKYFGDFVGELRTEALFARLNKTSVLDLSGAEGNILPNGELLGSSQASNMDKWLAAGNIELFPMKKNLYVGVTPMYIFDNKDSYTYTYRHLENDVSEPYELTSINPFEPDAQKTFIVSGRLGGDIAGFLKSKNLVLDLVGEFAYSSDDVYSHSWVLNVDGEGMPVLDDYGEEVYTDLTEKETSDGTALLVTLNAGYQKENAFGVLLALDFVRNDSSWFNNLAQSPKFFARRILNTDKDGNSIRYGVYSPLYSTFDALYNYSPKYAPAATTLGTDDNAIQGGKTESYNIAPFNKNSWKGGVYTRYQLAILEMLSDPALQLTLPNGLATANRQGTRATLTANWKDYAEAQGLFSYFTQVSPIPLFKEATYMEFGGGAKIDIFKILGFQKPLEISGSYKHSERSIDTDGWVEAEDLPEGTLELKSDFINAGLYVQYLPRLGVTAGFQYVTTEYNKYQQMMALFATPMIKSTQMQWMVGLDYTLAKNAWFSLNYGMIFVENEYDTSQYYESEGSDNLPTYYVQSDETGKFKHKFSRSVIEASINVEF